MITTNRADTNYFFTIVDSPVGRLKLVGARNVLAAVHWERDDPQHGPRHLARESPGLPILVETARQLEEYFAGKRTAFDLTLDFIGTDFQRAVWNALLTIPFGETRSYGQIAAQIGAPKAVRAVGAANGRNPIPIIAPCHRVIGSNGKLTGFGGGLPIKAQLLTLEGAWPRSFGV